MMLSRSDIQWLMVIAFTLICIMLKPHISILAAFPADWQLSLSTWLNMAMRSFLDAFGGAFYQAFRTFSWLLGFPVRWVREFLQWVPWSVVIVLVTFAAYHARGWRLAVFATLSMLYMLVIGYWQESMNSLALVALSVPLAVLLGFLLGSLGFLSRRIERLLMPVLDLLQTVPAFAYLIPIIILFGFGPVVGLIASILYAVSPMVRNTMLGLRAVPAEIIESGLMSGATPLQLFFQVRVPSALKQLLLGINQTTMAAFTMVIIASIIGGTDDIGWEVLSTIRKALFGESLLAGLVIALMAMIMDRITAGLADRSSSTDLRGRSLLARHSILLLALGAAAVLWIASLVITPLGSFPEAWVWSPAKWLNDAVAWLVLNWRVGIETIKTVAFFYLMLPMKIGLAQTVSPYSWGFEFTVWHAAAFGGMALAVAIALWRSVSASVAVAFVLLALVYGFGILNIPWPAVLAIACLLAWQTGGGRLTVGVLAGLAFLLVAGLWQEAMLSVYLCGIAVLICVVVGGLIGVAAAQSDRVSRLARPVNDTLQTMPLFVLLIPAVMFFKLGDFTAVIAIVLYAIVPMIRYTEHGLRSVPASVVEAAQSMGTTPAQMLLQVKLPQALPIVMLGLNQTVLYGISMLVITALVGTSDLGQRVYIGLGDGDFGVGMVAGLGMAFLAMIADRIIQAASRARQRALGMAEEAAL